MVSDGGRGVVGGGSRMQGGSAAQPEGLTQLVGARAELLSRNRAVVRGQGPAEPQFNHGC